MQAEELTTDGLQDSMLSQVRGIAFRILLETGKAVEAASLAAELGCDVTKVEEAVGELECCGLISRDEEGKIVGSFGLSIVPSRDEIHVGERRFWTWCAKTSLGVLGALARGGLVVSHSPFSGRELRVAFEGSCPSGEGLVVFWPSSDFTASCSSAIEQVCPNISFFESVEAAESWAAVNRVPGEVLSTDEATVRAIEKWGPLVASARL